MEAIQKEKIQEAHKAIDLEAKLVRATAEMTALQEKTSQQDATLKALTE